MKYLIVIVIALVSISSAKAQEELPDTVFTTDQVVRITEVIDSLENRVNYLESLTTINENLVGQYKKNNEELQSLISSYEKYSYIQEAQIQLFDLNMKRYQEYIKAEKKPFYDRPVVWLVIGAGTMYLASEIVSNVK